MEKQIKKSNWIIQKLVQNKDIIAVLLIGFIIWFTIFLITANSYLHVLDWNKMFVDIGPAPHPSAINLFGYTILYQYEGFTDYAYYYVHWGHNVLNGVPIYSNDFGYINLDGIVNHNGAYIFPPFTAWLYGLGVLLHPRIGIAFLIVLLGYLTAIPVYGIAKEFTNNEKYGALAAATYLFNPLTLYYIAYLWLNPSTFYFFVMMGLWMLVRGNDVTGSMFIITAALFKQTAWFIGMPLIIYLLMKNKRIFGKVVGISLIYFGVVMIPFIGNLIGTITIWFRGLGSYPYKWGFEYPHDYGFPNTLTDVFINLGLYDLAEIYYNISSTGILMFIGIVVIAIYMVKTMREKKVNRIALKRMIFLTMLLLIWIHIFGPRGSFKYYISFLAPFFSIFSSGAAIKTKDYAPVSDWSIWAPGILGLIIMFILRYNFLLVLLAVMIIYIDHERMMITYDSMKRNCNKVWMFLKNKWRLLNRLERKLSMMICILLLIIPLSGASLNFIGYTNGYLFGFNNGQISVQRDVIIEFGDLIPMPCARNITIVGIDGNNYINSFWEFEYNFTYYAGRFYLGSVVLINITLFFNITAGYNDNTTLYGSYIVGKEPVIEDWLFIREDWISLTTLKVYDLEILI